MTSPNTQNAGTILIVDDAAIHQKVAGDCVRAEGFETHFASQGCEALKRIGEHAPDLVLTDLYMPEMDGLELIKSIRAEHSHIPVILMTGQGTDETALQALKAGAASYIPKHSLKKNVGDTIRAVLLAAKAVAQTEASWTFLSYGESHYVLGYEPHARGAMIGYFENELARMNFCDPADQIRVGTALSEALANAIDHGNLELDSSLRGNPDLDYYQVGQERQQTKPYCERRVHITNRVTPSEVTYIIRDEGPGFDHDSLPDPTDPENLTKLSGRGLLLIRTFLDEVRFNDRGNEITMLKRRASV